jgi:hypothetical protein
LLGICYIICMCVCVGASGLTTAFDDPSSSALCVVCTGCFLGGASMAPLGYAQHLALGGSSGQHPKIYFWVMFSIFSRFRYF